MRPILSLQTRYTGDQPVESPMLPELSSARKNSKSRNGKSCGSSSRHAVSFTCSILERRSIRIASAPDQPRRRHYRSHYYRARKEEGTKF
jgi:hypothetical protein